MKNIMPDFENYISPYTWRYSSPEMRQIWSEKEKRRFWRLVWAALAEVQAGYGLANQEQVSELRSHVGDVNVERSLEIESEIQHDLMAELKAFAEQCPIGGRVLHQGATSMDIEDNADALRILKSLDLVLEKLRALLLDLAELIDRWADRPIMAFTHLQPAEPSTLGYRLAQYAQDLLSDWNVLHFARDQVRGKGFKGAVGTGASYGELIGVENLAQFEERLSERLNLPFYPVSTQTYPRKQEYMALSSLAGLGGSLYKFAFDLRLLQSPSIGELSEPFGSMQVGSSAMPFKRNPVTSEKIDSLARALAGLPRLAWDNAAHSLLERTLDDSANRRTLLPEAFLITDELLIATRKIVGGLRVDEAAMARNLELYSPFAATERVLMALSKAGADRQLMHERLRQLAMAAWDDIRKGLANPLIELVAEDNVLQHYLKENVLRSLMDASVYIGYAPQKARAMALAVRRAAG